MPTLTYSRATPGRIYGGRFPTALTMTARAAALCVLALGSVGSGAAMTMAAQARATCAIDLVSPLPSWVPAAGGSALLTNSNGGLTNHFRDVVDTANFDPFYSAKIISDYSGGIANRWYGTLGAMVYHGGGHGVSCTNDNSVFGLVAGSTSMSFKRFNNPTPFGPGHDTDTGVSIDSTHGEYSLDHQPTSVHSYGDPVVIGPADGGATNGTLHRQSTNSMGVAGQNYGQFHHKMDLTLSGTTTWVRDGIGVTPGNPSAESGAPCWSVHVPAQQRIYIETHGLLSPQWFDLATSTYVQGTGTSRGNAGTLNGGQLIYVPARSLLVFINTASNVYTMDVSVSNPSWVDRGTPFSPAISLPSDWSMACWCEDNNSIVIGYISGDLASVREVTIPATLSDPWTNTRVALSFTPNWPQGTGYSRWGYLKPCKCIPLFAYAAQTGDDTVYVYRPTGT